MISKPILAILTVLLVIVIALYTRQAQVSNFENYSKFTGYSNPPDDPNVVQTSGIDTLLPIPYFVKNGYPYNWRFVLPYWTIPAVY
jgi:hypothetical protein